MIHFWMLPIHLPTVPSSPRPERQNTSAFCTFRYKSPPWCPRHARLLLSSWLLCWSPLAQPSTVAAGQGRSTALVIGCSAPAASMTGASAVMDLGPTVGMRQIGQQSATGQAEVAASCSLLLEAKQTRGFVDYWKHAWCGG